MSKTNKTATVIFAAAFFALSLLFSARSLALSENGVTASANGEKMLIAAGIPFGVRLHTDGVIVVNLTKVGESSPALAAGLRKGDIIKKINGKNITGAKALCDAVEQSDGKLKVSFLRAGKEKELDITPIPDKSGVYKIGVVARDSAAGIGTLTFIDPETGLFAGLGHGICDAETGELIPISYGTAEEVVLTDIIKGKSGAPGELRGFFSGKKTGKITGNTYSGVVGALLSVPEELKQYTFPARGRGKIKNGKAYIYSSVDGGREAYEVEITILDEQSGGKNFTVEIKDSSLIAKTGGIVQGMSGSPVVQDGYLIGALTHVTVSDPTRGYGILIENMLEKAMFLDTLKVA